MFSDATFALQVDYAGKTIATVKSENDFDNAITIIAKKVYGSNVASAVEKPVFTKAIVPSALIDDSLSLADAIIDNTDKIIQAHQLKVNDKNVACINGDFIFDLLENRRNSYNSTEESFSEFVDDIDVVTGLFLSEELTSIKDAVEIIDTLEVRTVMNISHDTPVKFSTVVEKTPEILKGDSVVKVNGRDGLQRITETVTLINGKETSRESSQNLLSEPITKIVQLGTAQSFVSDKDKQTLKKSGFLFPLPKTGWRVSAYFGDGRNHQAIDLAAKKGTPIYAVKPGRVVEAGWKGSYGKQILIDHGYGLKTRYAHEDEINVKVGDKVEAGEMIGRVGRTGNATGNHIHFEVIVNGKRVDPAPYIGLAK